MPKGYKQTKNHEKTLSNSLSLVWALFEEIRLALNVYDSGDFPVKDPWKFILHYSMEVRRLRMDMFLVGKIYWTINILQNT